MMYTEFAGGGKRAPGWTLVLEVNSFLLLSGRGDSDVFSLQMKETYLEHPISGPQRTHT